MMMRRLYLLCLLNLLIAVSSIRAWGEVGHEIVATIAQTQLHPAVRQHLCDILPANRTSYISHYPRNQGPQKHCHLAPFAGWPDRVRRFYPWSGHLHYVNPVDDEPPKHCTYGEYGWKDNGTGNVLEALVNYTSLVSISHGQDRDIALRFLVHYMGDAHQPLHLTGRARGGNDIAVRFEGRYAKLHTVWDSLLINAQIRQLANYTTRLPSARIESALVGKSYDAYIRWILAEGLGQGGTIKSAESDASWWSDEQSEWVACPAKSHKEAHINVERPAAHWLRPIAPQTSTLAERIFSMTFSSSKKEKLASTIEQIDDTDLPVCPYAWTKPMHPLVCAYAFADPVPPADGDHHGPLAELDVEEYKGRIEADHIIQKQLAKAGIRLAAVLNTLLLPEALAAQQQSEKSQFSHVSTYITPTISSDDDTHKKRKKRESRHGSTQSPILGLVKVTAESIAEVILLSSVGYVLARQGVLDKKTQTRINKLNVSFFTPALLFSKVAFTLNPARLAELIIVPAGFVIITTVSFLAALLLSWTAGLSKSQRNFSIACAITPNSNSLPVALMQSLVVTVPQLHWEEEGEPEDTPNGMLGRALTYLVLFSTLGMFLRWSVASQLLSTMDEEDEQPETVPTARLIDHDDHQSSQDSTSTHLKNGTPQITIRRSTEEGGRTEAAPPANFTGEEINSTPNRRPSRSRTGPPAWARSFPNTPGVSESGSEDEEQEETTSRQIKSVSKKVWEKGIKKPLQAVGRFMTMPLYAAVISLVVALIPPLQKVIGSIEPLVGALETGGACSIPLTMVVLGAYFYQEAEPPSQTAAEVGDSARRLTASPPPQSDISTSQSQDREATLVGAPAEPKRKSLPWMRNPWKSSSAPSSRNGSIEYSVNGDSTDDDLESRRNTQLNSSSESNSWWSSSRRDSVLSVAERKKKKQTSMERRTIAVAVASRMLLTPLILLPLAAYFALATIGNVMDDPVFITSACLLIGSPPALTLAQITSQSAKGSNSSFERLISKTIFTSYAILAAPSSILLVLTALLIAEKDHR